MTGIRSGMLFPILTAAVLLTACSDNSTGSGDDGDGGNGGNGNNPPGGTVGKVTMTINGAAWESDVATANAVMQNGQILPLGVGGVKNFSDTFSFAAAALAGIGEQTYTAGGTTTTVSATFVSNADTTLTATLDSFQPVGQVTFSEIDNADGTVSGTFSFDLVRSDSTILEIRNGTFTEIDVPGL